MLIDLEGWVPVAVDGDAVEWRHLPGQRFTEPFFEDTLRRHPPAPVRRITRAEAVEWAARHPGLAPTGFVFHLSRCGSTLVAQMLAAVEENRVTSEPPAADQALAAGDPGLVGAILSALARPNAGETRFFVKFDCWHIHHYALVRRVFPSVPAIFLYRDPLEVLVSQMRNPGMWTVGSGELPRERHVAGLLERILRAALGHADTLRLVNYTELPESVYTLFGVEWTDAQLAAMHAAAGADAKTPQMPFTPDSEEKRARATESMRTEIAAAREAYEALEVRRKNQ